MTREKLRGNRPISTMAVMIRRWRLWRRNNCFNPVTPRFFVTTHFPWSIQNCQVQVTPLPAAEQLTGSAFPEDKEGAGDKDRGIGPNDHAQKQRQGEVMQHLASRHGQGNEH